MTVVVQQDKSDQRDKILQRVLNLRSRAEDSGSSEAEMNTALTMAMKLMTSYNIEEAELALAETEGRIVLEIVEKRADVTCLKGKRKHKITAVLNAIAAFTETKEVMNTGSGKIAFTGHRPDTELANFLVTVIREALDREYGNYRRSTPAVGYGAKTSFQHAMANRVSNRLYAMANERKKERTENKRKAELLQIEDSNTSSSTALVVSEIAEQKAKEVKAAFEKAYPKLRKISTSSRLTNGSAFSAGKSAGDRVNLGRAIGNSQQRKLA